MVLDVSEAANFIHGDWLPATGLQLQLQQLESALSRSLLYLI